MITTIIFDWHGVLDETKFENLLIKLAELSSKSKDEVKALIKVHEREYAKGTLSPSVFWSKVEEVLHLRKDQITQSQSSILTVKKYQLLWDELPSLKEKYKLAILSDCPLDKVNVIKKECDLSLFSIVHFSAEKHLLKDSDEFFLQSANELHETPQNCLYVDDSEKHIVTAKRLGFVTCHFSSIEDLHQALKN